MQTEDHQTGAGSDEGVNRANSATNRPAVSTTSRHPSESRYLAVQSLLAGGGLDLDNSADRRITPVRWPRALRPACRGRSSGSARRACRPARRLNVHCRRLLKDRLQRDDRGDCGLDFGRDGNRLRLGRCGKRVFSPLMLYRPGHRSDSGVSLASSDNPDRAKVCR